MSDADLKFLKNQRSSLKGRLTFFANLINKNINSYNEHEFESVLIRLRILYDKFDQNQCEMEKIENCDLDIENEIREQFETDYGSLESKILLSIKTLQTKIKLKDDQLPIGGQEKPQSFAAIKLPIIALPQFDGNFMSWLSFRDVYLDLIHNNANLSKTSKFHYLISCLRDGKAFQYIESLPVTVANYTTAWDTIFNFFENELLIKKVHMKEIYEINKVQENSARSLGEFVDNVWKHLNALTALKVNIDSWDLFLIHHLSQRLDIASRREIEIESNKNNKLLTTTEFLDILRNRAKVLASLSPPEVVGSKSTKPNNTVGSKNSRVLTSTSVNCFFCKEAHFSYSCPKFLSLTVENRFNLVKELTLCINCFSNTHKVSECTRGGCRICSMKHHSLLHRGKQNNITNPKRFPFQQNPNLNVSSQNSSQSRRNFVSLVPNSSSNLDSNIASQIHSENPSNLIPSSVTMERNVVSSEPNYSGIQTIPTHLTDHTQPRLSQQHHSSHSNGSTSQNYSSSIDRSLQNQCYPSCVEIGSVSPNSHNKKPSCHLVQNMPSSKTHSFNTIENSSRGLTQRVSSRNQSNNLQPVYPIPESDAPPSSLHSCSPISQAYQVMLATAIVWVEAPSGVRVKCRVLLDGGSQSNFITENLCQTLKCRRASVSIPIIGINQSVTQIRYAVNLEVGSRISDFRTKLDFLVLPKITGHLPLHTANIDIKRIPASVQLADPMFFQPDRIDMLIGAELFYQVLIGDSITLLSEFPPFINSVFGYIISGKVPSKIQQISTSFVCTLDQLSLQIQQFWKLEQLSAGHLFSQEEKACEESFVKHVVRGSDGRYSVALPLKHSVDRLADNKTSSLRQFRYLEQRLLKSAAIMQDYSNFLQEYLDLHHMELVRIDQNSNNNIPIFHLPHHPVMKETSSTTRLRVVFNASSKSQSGISLNEVLMIGPTVQDDLFSIVIRFRKHKIAFTADIAKMYRQIQIHSEYRDLHRIFWRKSPNEPMQCYKLGTVTYGTSSAPFLATRTLKLAIDEGERFPEASEILARDFYIDDVLSGAPSPEKAKFLQTQLIQLLASGGFELRKWISNHSSVVSDELNTTGKPISILGINWDTDKDIFYISLGNFETNSNLITKRSVLLAISKIFDPMGLCGPVVFHAKMYMQQIWSLQDVTWDTELPSPIKESWKSFYNQLCDSHPITIPRCVIPVAYKTIELHGFGDASEKGYGACIYIRTTDQDDKHHIRLLCAKSRVASLRTQSIPRLELCAALLLSELILKVQAALDVKFDQIYYWSDSQITLLRIKSPPAKFTTFVGNRVAQIQESSSPNNWKFVPTTDNPADPLSRGLTPEQIRTSSLWWNGPSFLKEDLTHWPKSQNASIEDDQMEYKKIPVTLTSTTTIRFDLFEKFSNYNTLLRITALCIRFYTNIRLPRIERNYNAVTVEELENALKQLIKRIQLTEYKSEIQSLHLNRAVDRTSKIKYLSPFIDVDGILRVGGRLNYAQISYNHQHQYLLPSSHVFSKLLIQHYHIKNLHAGPQALLSYTRHKFWITGARSLCKATVHRCLICFKSKPKSISQIMGQLPSERITPSRPFSNVGVDFFGPFNLIALPRSKTVTKVYVAIYICFSTKAVHMELVHSLSTQSFIASLHRFVSRRGRPTNIYSDNATNSVGAKSELNQLLQLFNSDIHKHKILKQCSEVGITWKNIPPRSPHFGGLWEAAVKSAKHHMKRTLSDDNYLLEELATVIAQTEACMNSRPITAMSDDPADYTPLTPGHFIIGEPLNAIPMPNLLDIKENRLSKFQRLQGKMQIFWKRWSSEYL